MTKKMVFFDLDGTLVDSNKKISETTKQALSSLQKNGIIPVIATGRPPYMFESIREELNIHNFVSTNGQYVIYEDEVIYEDFLDRDLIDELVKDASARGHNVAFFNTETFKETFIKHSSDNEKVKSFYDTTPLIDHTFHLQETIHQALLLCKEDEESYYKSAYPHFEFIRWGDEAMDILPKGGSKARGIHTLLNKLNIKIENTYAFGDGLNDVAMFELVGNGIAMYNGRDELKKVASHITTSCDDDGIINGLKHYKLIG